MSDFLFVFKCGEQLNQRALFSSLVPFLLTNQSVVLVHIVTYNLWKGMQSSVALNLCFHTCFGGIDAHSVSNVYWNVSDLHV